MIEFVDIARKANLNPAFNTQTGDYTLVGADNGKAILMNDAGVAQNLTVPPFSSVAFPLNTVIPVYQLGTKITNIVAGAGVTINSFGSLSTPGQYSLCLLVQVAIDSWLFVEDTGLLTVEWGSITGTLNAQTDLQNALDVKADIGDNTSFNNLVTTAAAKITYGASQALFSTFATITSDSIQSVVTGQIAYFPINLLPGCIITHLFAYKDSNSAATGITIALESAINNSGWAVVESGTFLSNGASLADYPLLTPVTTTDYSMYRIKLTSTVAAAKRVIVYSAGVITSQRTV